MGDALLASAILILFPLAYGFLIAYTVHHIVGFFVTRFGGSRFEELSKAYKSFVNIAIDLLVLWAIGALALVIAS